VGGFDLTFTGNFVLVPATDKDFSLDGLGLTGNYTDAVAPTAAGKSQDGPEIQYFPDGGGGYLVSYNTPKGTGLPFIFSPMVKAAIGLPGGIELMGRYSPTLKMGKSGSINLWGIGIKNDILQYFGPADKVPVFNFSWLVAYSKMKSMVGLNVTPESFGATDATTSITRFVNQQMDFNVGSFTAGLQASFDFPVVSLYAGAGFASTKTKLALTGTYPVPKPNGTVTDDSAVTDPFSIEIKNKQGGTTNPRLNGGIRFKFAVITFHVDYTRADYSLITTGLGLSIR
jgi:hypothetical protein